MWHELAFGLECMGLSVGVIRRRVAEMAAFFGMESWFRNKTYALSGGQKQLLNLAGALAMDPRLLILDEPTAMLDPLAARELLDAVSRINKELGVAVLITEHRLEQVLPAADKVAVMERGRIISQGRPEETVRSLCRSGEGDRLFFGMSAPVRIFAALGQEELPLTVRDALKRILGDKKAQPLSVAAPKISAEPILSAKELWFRYDAKGADVLRGADISLCEGELMCLLGGNGAGKSTLLSVLCGLNKAYRGKVKLDKGKKLCMLPQNAPSRIEMGIERIIASTTPGMPQICQSETKIRAISPAIAPSVIPKFRPMPAIIGISRLRMRNALRPRRVEISLSR